MYTPTRAHVRVLSTCSDINDISDIVASALKITRVVTQYAGHFEENDRLARLPRTLQLGGDLNKRASFSAFLPFLKGRLGVG